MARIVIRNKVEKLKEKDLITEIYNKCKEEIYLSPRSKHEISEAYKRNNLFIAMENSKILGWLITIPYNNNFQELVAGYIYPNYRKKRIFELLLKKATLNKDISMFATFNRGFANHAIKNLRFVESSLVEVVILSRGKFLLKRLNIHKMKSIFNHYKTEKPLYLKIKDK